jgi:hypothetical protein
MKNAFQSSLASTLGFWAGTGLVFAAGATVFFQGPNLLIAGGRIVGAVTSPLVTSEAKAYGKCAKRVWDSNGEALEAYKPDPSNLSATPVPELRKIGTECGERPAYWIWEARQ